MLWFDHVMPPENINERDANGFIPLVGCKVGTVASFVFPAVAPIAGGVCTASRITGVVNGVVNRR